MNIKLNFIALFCLLSMGCSDAFLEGLPANELEQSLIEHTWTKKNFWIDQESIVFELEVDFYPDNTFMIEAKVLGKKNTSFKQYLWSGKWKYLASTEMLELAYDTDFGIVGYYLDQVVKKEVYQLHTETETVLILKSSQANHFFELELAGSSK